MKRKPLWTGIGACAGMLILILDGKSALDGARTGIDLCLKTVIPSLFPFFVLSILLTGSLAGSFLPVLRPLGKLCGIPEGTESILLCGFLGGYPVGAQSVTSAYRSGQLSKTEAERMLAFCNNAGPAFLFGMAASVFNRQWMAWVLWGIHIASALTAAQFFPGNYAQRVTLSSKNQTSVTSALNMAIRVMASVCGWVILFRVMITFLTRWVLWVFPKAVQVGIIGFLELSNGCCELIALPDGTMRFLLCSGMLAFGGLCVTMQTLSVTGGLSLRHYFSGKLLQTLFSLLLTAAVVCGAGLPCCAALLLFTLILRKTQKKSSIRQVVGV